MSSTPDVTDHWLQIASVTAPLIPNIIDLGRGEAEVIALGLALRREAPRCTASVSVGLGEAREAKPNSLIYA